MWVCVLVFLLKRNLIDNNNKQFAALDLFCGVGEAIESLIKYTRRVTEGIKCKCSTIRET